jgi:hypothetical protein
MAIEGWPIVVVLTCSFSSSCIGLAGKSMHNGRIGIGHEMRWIIACLEISAPIEYDDGRRKR